MDIKLSSSGNYYCSDIQNTALDVPHQDSATYISYAEALSHKDIKPTTDISARKICIDTKKSLEEKLLNSFCYMEDADGKHIAHISRLKVIFKKQESLHSLIPSIEKSTASYIILEDFLQEQNIEKDTALTIKNELQKIKNSEFNKKFICACIQLEESLQAYGVYFKGGFARTIFLEKNHQQSNIIQPFNDIDVHLPSTMTTEGFIALAKDLFKEKFIDCNYIPDTAYFNKNDNYKQHQKIIISLDNKTGNHCISDISIDISIANKNSDIAISSSWLIDDALHISNSYIHLTKTPNHKIEDKDILNIRSFKKALNFLQQCLNASLLTEKKEEEMTIIIKKLESLTPSKKTYAEIVQKNSEKLVVTQHIIQPEICTEIAITYNYIILKESLPIKLGLHQAVKYKQPKPSISKVETLATAIKPKGIESIAKKDNNKSKKQRNKTKEINETATKKIVSGIEIPSIFNPKNVRSIKEIREINNQLLETCRNSEEFIYIYDIQKKIQNNYMVYDINHIIMSNLNSIHTKELSVEDFKDHFIDTLNYTPTLLKIIIDSTSEMLQLEQKETKIGPFEPSYRDLYMVLNKVTFVLLKLVYYSILFNETENINDTVIFYIANMDQATETLSYIYEKKILPKNETELLKKCIDQFFIANIALKSVFNCNIELNIYSERIQSRIIGKDIFLLFISLYLVKVGMLNKATEYLKLWLDNLVNRPDGEISEVQKQCYQHHKHILKNDYMASFVNNYAKQQPKKFVKNNYAMEILFGESLSEQKPTFLKSKPKNKKKKSRR